MRPARSAASRRSRSIGVSEASAKSVGSLINDLARLFKINFDRQSRSLGLTRAQWQLLLHLYRHEGMTQTELAAVLELSVPTVGNLVHRLVARGWVEIRVDPNHRLNKYLYLLPTVHPLLKRVHKIAGDVDEQSLHGLSVQETKMLLDVLARMKRNLGLREPRLATPLRLNGGSATPEKVSRSARRPAG